MAVDEPLAEATPGASAQSPQRAYRERSDCASDVLEHACGGDEQVRYGARRVCRNAVGETLDLLSIDRTSRYAAVKRGDLKCVKFGKKTLFCAADLASFLTRLRRTSEAKADRVGRPPSSSRKL
jgi:hypothetical protein